MVPRHAESLYIDVMFELDTPAHTMSWGRSHPEVMAQCWDWLESKQSHPSIAADHLDAMAIDPLAQFNGGARALVTDLLTEMAGLSSSPYFHIGVRLLLYSTRQRTTTHTAFVAAYAWRKGDI